MRPRERYTLYNKELGQYYNKKACRFDYIPFTFGNREDAEKINEERKLNCVIKFIYTIVK